MPDRPHANRGAAFETLFEAPLPGLPVRGGPLPVELRRYGPRLAVALRPNRPTVIVNFVESIDGVVTVDPKHGSGGEVSGFNEPDRFVMGLLRSLSDAVVVGAGTVRAAPNHAWTPERVNPEFAGGFAAWRRDMGLSRNPTAMIVTASGNIDPAHPALFLEDAPTFVLTTRDGAARLRGRLPTQVRVVDTGDAHRVAAAAIVRVATDNGVRLLLCEGGPHLNGTLLAANMVDELFLTVAPQLLGRAGPDKEERYGLVEGVSLGADGGRWGRLQSVRRSVDHLFLRYAFDRE